MSEKFLINDSLNLKVTIHGEPDPMQFIEAFIQLNEDELIEMSDENKEKDSNLFKSE